MREGLGLEAFGEVLQHGLERGMGRVALSGGENQIVHSALLGLVRWSVRLFALLGVLAVLVVPLVLRLIWLVRHRRFSAHARLARTAGVSDDTIKAIATGTAPAGLSGDEALLVGYVHELLRDHKVKDATYKALVDRFGQQDTLHLAVLVGHYLLVAQVLMTVDVELGEGMVAEIPE